MAFLTVHAGQWIFLAPLQGILSYGCMQAASWRQQLYLFMKAEQLNQQPRFWFICAWGAQCDLTVQCSVHMHNVFAGCTPAATALMFSLYQR